MTENIDLNEISIKHLLKIFLDNKLKIISFSLLSGMIFVFYSFFLSNVYTSYSTVDIHGDEASMQFGAGIEAVAALSGIPKSSSEKNLVIETLKSRDFYEFLMKNENTVENFSNAFLENSPNYKISERDLDYIYGKYLKNLEVLSSTSGFLKLSFTSPEAILSKNILTSIIEGINEKIRERDLRKARESIEYLKNRYSEDSIASVKKSVASLLEIQLKQEMLSSINKFYVLEYIDSPSLPKGKSSPLRIVYFFAGLFIGFIISFLYFFYLNSRELRK